WHNISALPLFSHTAHRRPLTASRHRPLSSSRRVRCCRATAARCQGPHISGYQKVAKGKSCLYTLISAQVLIQLCGVVYLFILTSKRETLDKLAISSAITGLSSLIVGELGC
ncbi:uncharacterized protein LOC111021370, partial [Momordica charantia]|uniref:Uncharacterized protein LOC111021370 n=1 Tax=Momordica charantia TaxID=3673 RepID=A0A6J1DIF4_MOMCH